ncbi:MAG: hypothetical protein ACJ8FU_08670 [Xanthobacteraceae bacterium]
MAYLKADIVSATLVDLGVRAIGETAASSETTEVGTRFDAALSLIVQETGVTIDPAAIAVYLHRPLVGYLVRVCAPTFGAEANDEQTAAAWDLLVAAVRTGNAAASSVADKLIEETLLALGHLEPGQHASATDKAYVSGLLDNALSDFTRRDVIVIANQAAITAEQSNALRAYLVEQARPKFQDGKPGDAQAMAATEDWLRTLYRRALSAGSTTKDKLVEQVLVTLGRTPPGGYPSTADKLLVTRQLDFILADLAGRNVIYIADSDSIEDAQFSPLVDYVGEVLAPQISMPRRARDGEMQRQAEARLRTLSRIGQGTGANLSIDAALRSRTRVRSFANFSAGL